MIIYNFESFNLIDIKYSSDSYCKNNHILTRKLNKVFLILFQLKKILIIILI